MTIKKKLVLGFLCIICGFFFIGVLNYLYQDNFRIQLNQVSHKLYQLDKKSHRGKLILRQILLDVLKRNRGDAGEADRLMSDIDQKAIEFYKNIDSLILYGNGKDPVPASIREQFQQFYILSKRVTDHITRAELDKHPDTLALYYKLEGDIQRLIDQSVQKYESKFESALNELDRKGNRSIYISLLLSLFGILFSIIVFLILRRALIRPIDNILETVDLFIRTGKGEATVFNRDELGMMAESFNRFSMNLRETIQDLRQEVKGRKAVEKDLLKLKDILSSIVDSMPSVLIGVNGDQMVAQWNQAAVRETGIEKTDALGKSVVDLFPKLKPLEQIMGDSIQKREIKKDQLQIQDANQSNHVFEVTVYPLLDSLEKGAVIRLDDITERKKLEEEMARTQKMFSVGELAAGMAHDFNNVLGGIVGTLSLLQVRREKNKLTLEKLDDYLEDMNKSAGRATDIVRQLMALSRKQKLSLQATDLNRIIQNIVKIGSNSFDKSVRITPFYAIKPAYIKADPTQIEQVLLNIAINGSHAMTLMREEGSPWGGELKLGLTSFFADKDFCDEHPEAKELYYWEVFVEDNGVGMDDRVKSKIFDPFFTTKPKETGNGLGLSMVYNIVKQHGGFIKLKTRPGKGTRFSLFFPQIIEGKENMQQKDNEKYDMKYSGLALVVDDESIMRKVASAILSEIGFNVISANDGEAGIETFLENRDALKFIILDLMMPKKSGDEVLQEIKKYREDVKVLIASGSKKDERINRILGYKNVEFIEKPYSFKQLSEAVRELLSRDTE